MSQAPPRTIRRATVFTHHRPDQTADGIQALIEVARTTGVELLFDSEETAKHELGRFASDGVRANVDPAEKPDVCIVLGGDGATLRALRHHAGTDVPVFAVNYGRIGFLATVDREDLPHALELAVTGQFEVVRLPALLTDAHSTERFAINEVSFQRRPHMNVTHLSYSLAGEWVARVPCDGLIAATPAGSTAYSLSVGGPIVAWGVQGFVVNLIAPHALSSRALVAAPEDVLRVVNDGDEPVDIVIDGMTAGELGGREESEITLKPDVVGLAQLPGSSFYRRFREKLLQLTS
ncbi:MAG: NAD(+)/NADH kinase [Solirubrobacterales bacterium]